MTARGADLRTDEAAPISRRPRILFGGFVHETHGFLEQKTGAECFRISEGESIFQLRGDSSPSGGFLEVADRMDWTVVPSVLAVAEPSGTVTAEAFESVWRRFCEHAIPAIGDEIDAIYLVLHGAGVCESSADLEGELLSRIRNLPGASSIPIYGVYDLHANFSSAMAVHSDCLIAYRKNPHTDARFAAMRAADILATSLAEKRLLRQQVRFAPVLWPPTGTASAVSPMSRLLQRAAEIEADLAAVIAISINAGFSFADGPHVGLSFTTVIRCDATASQLSEIDEALDGLTAIAIRHASDGRVLDESVDDAFTRLNRWRDEGDLTGLHVLVEPSDNIGGGGPGAGVTLLRRLHDEQFENVGFALRDEAAVAELWSRPVGDRVRLSLGGKGSRLYDPPLTLDCELLSRGDGRFQLQDRHSHLAAQCGDSFDMGRCAVVRSGQLTILLSTIATPPMDLGQWIHFGIDPQNFTLMVVKAAVAHRQAYDPIARRQIWVDTPGPCSSDLSRFDYQRLRQPMLPFQELGDGESSGVLGG